MTKRIWLCIFGAALLASAAPVVSAARHTAVTQSSVKKKKGVTSKNITSKNKKKVKATAKGQKAPTSDRIREIQEALNREGDLVGQPTGKWDDATVEAMKKFQEAHGVSPSGKIDAVTLNKLGLGPETAGKGAPFPTASSTPASSTASPSTTPPVTSAH
jgi:peptidoglycan hydrolase-like protein with peptidoglycan-binding domain